DQQIRIGDPGRVEPALDRGLVDVFRPQPAGGYVLGDQPPRAGQLGAGPRRTAPGAVGPRRSRSPRKRTRTPCRCSSSASREMYSSSRDMSAVTSEAGRCQFSWEKANSESTHTPAAIAPSTTSRTDFI